MALDGPSTEFLVETSRDTDWTGLGLLSRWTEVCRVYWVIILYHCDQDILSTSLKIHRVDGRDTAYIPAKFPRNSFIKKREISVQHIFQGWFLLTLTFNLRPWNLHHQVVSLSRTINQLKTMKWQRNGWINIFIYCHLVTLTFDLRNPKMYTAILQVIIYQPAKYERDPIN